MSDQASSDTDVASGVTDDDALSHEQWSEMLGDEHADDLKERLINMVLDVRGFVETSREPRLVKFCENLIERWTGAFYLTDIPIPDPDKLYLEYNRLLDEQHDLVRQLDSDKLVLRTECELLKIQLAEARKASASAEKVVASAEKAVTSAEESVAILTEAHRDYAEAIDRQAAKARDAYFTMTDRAERAEAECKDLKIRLADVEKTLGAAMEAVAAGNALRVEHDNVCAERDLLRRVDENRKKSDIASATTFVAELEAAGVEEPDVLVAGRPKKEVTLMDLLNHEADQLHEKATEEIRAKRKERRMAERAKERG